MLLGKTLTNKFKFKKILCSLVVVTNVFASMNSKEGNLF